MTDEAIDELVERIIGCAIEVHRVLGPGLLESVYRDCLIIEFKAAGLRVDSERRVDVNYKGSFIRCNFRIDLIVENTIVIELKTVEALHPVHIAQAITYLKLGDYPTGLIMNFNVNLMKYGIRRVDHPDRYEKRARRINGVEQPRT